MSSIQNWIREANHMPWGIEYHISSRSGESEVVYADNPDQVIEIYGKKCIGYIPVYDKRFANVEITDVKYRQKYLFFVVKSKPTHKMYLVNYYAGTNYYKDDLIGFEGEVYTCITSYKGQPMNLACKLLGVDKKHIKNVSVHSAIFTAEIMNLQTGDKYRYLTIPPSREELNAGQNKSTPQIFFEQSQFYKFVEQNAIKSFPQVNEVDFNKYTLNSYKFL